MATKFAKFLAVFAIVILATYFGYDLYTTYTLSQKSSLPSPLLNVDFPSEKLTYPKDWPDDLKYPEEFVLVDFTSGVLPQDSATGWGTKLRFQGEPSDATEGIIQFFEEKGWRITKKSELDTGGYILLVERGKENGIVVIDHDPSASSQVLVIATIFL